MAKKKLIKLGSQAAKSGFKNEKDIVKKFNNWQNDEDAQEWLFTGEIKPQSGGKVRITDKGSLKIGKITMQRKGGDAGRETSKMLQFKINPIELFNR